MNTTESAKVGLIEIEDGIDAIEAIEKYGEDWIDGMKHRGEIYEQRGKLYNLR